MLCASLLVVTRSTPESSFATLVYSLRWASPAGMWVWLAVGWAAAPLLARHCARPRVRGRVRDGCCRLPAWP